MGVVGVYRAVMVGDRVRSLYGYPGDGVVVGIMPGMPYPVSVKIDGCGCGTGFKYHELRPLVRVKARSRQIDDRSFRWKYGALAIRLLDGLSA